MTRIRFEDLPSTNTPRNAENLNKLNNVVINSTEPTTGEEVWIQKGKNLINKMIFGEAYIQSGIDYNVSWVRTDFIPIKLNVSYIFSHSLGSTAGNISVFDSNFNFIEQINSETITSSFTITNLNAKYVIINAWNPYVESQTETWMQFEQGDTATPYEPYTDKKIYTKNNNGVYEEFYNEKNLEVYSTSEQKIGTWIDGKPLYRKVLEFPNGIEAVTDLQGRVYNLSEFGINNVDEIHVVHPSYYSNVGWKIPFQFYDGNTFGIQVISTQLRIVCTYEAIAKSKMVVTLEYTKTTD